jgi:hypothetical protein
MILQLFGHRWPNELAALKPVSAEVSDHGLLPITEGTDRPVLLERVRERIQAVFPGADLRNAEEELSEILGRPLGDWLLRSFFQHHTIHFKRRPVIWQLSSRPLRDSRPRGAGGMRGSNRAPEFSCLLYYHKLNGNLLSQLRSEYLDPLRTRVRRELAEFGKASNLSATEAARRRRVELRTEELDVFDSELTEVAARGFDSARLAELAGLEPLDSWSSPNGLDASPVDRAAFHRQERQYIPDLNDGVRINIAPLQRVGVLAADVLGQRDVEKAIRDRAEWRADERRLCREGKLPRPIWWSAVARERG